MLCGCRYMLVQLDMLIKRMRAFPDPPHDHRRFGREEPWHTRHEGSSEAAARVSFDTSINVGPFLLQDKIAGTLFDLFRPLQLYSMAMCKLYLGVSLRVDLINKLSMSSVSCVCLQQHPWLGRQLSCEVQWLYTRRTTRFYAIVYIPLARPGDSH